MKGEAILPFFMPLDPGRVLNWLAYYAKAIEMI